MRTIIVCVLVAFGILFRDVESLVVYARLFAADTVVLCD